MFKKILIANRGEIAMRIIRTCREMGIRTVALYDHSSPSADYMRHAHECVLLPPPADFLDIYAIVKIAQDKGVDAIHPGYGFLAESPDFAKTCKKAGIAFIGPPAHMLQMIHCKLETLRRARKLGINTITFSPQTIELNADGPLPLEAARRQAQLIGYPLFIKSCSGRPWQVERLVKDECELEDGLNRARAESRSPYVENTFFLKKALIPACQITVSLMRDRFGKVVVLGDYQSVIQENTRRTIIEAPTICLYEAQRRAAWEIARRLAGELNLTGCATVDFMVNGDKNLYLDEIKPYLPFEAPLTEALLGIDLVREQLRLAAGERLSFRQDELHSKGWAILGCLRSNLPDSRFPNSGEVVQRASLPSGPHVRVDAQVYPGFSIATRFDTLLAKVTVWGEDRQACLERTRRAFQEASINGVSTNLGQLISILTSEQFTMGTYNTEYICSPCENDEEQEQHRRDLAVAAAILYTLRARAMRPAVSEQMLNGWRQKNRINPRWLYSGLTYEQISRNH